jgi:hypothetical protein
MTPTRLSTINFRHPLAWLALGLAGLPSWSQAQALECENWQSRHPDWIWCDDFENDAALESNYFQVDRAEGRFGVSNAAAFGGSRALRATFIQGDENAGGVKLSFGRTPVSPQLLQDRDFTQIYWRHYLMVPPGWIGNAMKVSRAHVFATSGWLQAAVGMVWNDSESGLSLGLDPVSGVDGSTVITTRYNDQTVFRWLGHRSAQTQVYAPANHGRWFCVEAHMRLNTPGQQDGSFTLWIDGVKEAENTGINFRGSYTAYGINALFLENYMNFGPSQTQSRYVDNFVVSRSRIGCADADDVRPRPVTNVIVP